MMIKLYKYCDVEFEMIRHQHHYNIPTHFVYCGLWQFIPFVGMRLAPHPWQSNIFEADQLHSLCLCICANISLITTCTMQNAFIWEQVFQFNKRIRFRSIPRLPTLQECYSLIFCSFPRCIEAVMPIVFL